MQETIEGQRGVSSLDAKHCLKYEASSSDEDADETISFLTEDLESLRA